VRQKCCGEDYLDFYVEENLEYFGEENNDFLVE
jgi:hypothetical protein